ncbi:MAG: response regulator [Ignavibacteriaceae bacterium]
MKISYRILFITFAVVVLIIGSSAFTFYSIMYNVLSSQQSKYLSNSVSNFSYLYREAFQNSEDDFLFLINSNEKLTEKFQKLPRQYPGKNIDFIFVSSADSSVLKTVFYKEDVNIPKNDFSIEAFLERNPAAVVKLYKSHDGSEYYYGRIINEKLLDEIAQKTGAEISVIWKDTPLEISNNSQNQKYIYALTQAYKSLSSTNNSKIYSQSTESTDILASLYETIPDVGKWNQIKFIVFTTLNEASDLKNNLKYILIIIGISGVILSLILTYVLTDSIRKRLTQLSKATEFTKEGKFTNKIDIKSKDEIGKLANAFNNMMDVLNKNQKARNEYSDFIALINQNPTLNEISEAALRKIIQTCNFTVGAIYSVDDKNISLICSYGLEENYTLADRSSFFEPAIKNKEIIEFNFTDQMPVIKTGIFSLQIKNLLIIPVVYNNKVIAVLELGAIDKPSAEAKQYLTDIQEQLAIGLTNAKALVQLENLVNELKKLNEDYQVQNEQVTKQNETLLQLHNQLKEKAEELTIQKQKAEESTLLKSQFLASISHELRTPMNSILGLTELILEESSLSPKNNQRLQVVLTSGKRLLSLINDILDLSKIEAGKMDVYAEEVVLDSFLLEIEAIVKPLVDQKSLKFKIHKHSNTNIILNVDRGKIAQVLMNLLGNAVKFTEQGLVELHVTLIDNKILKFDVIDSGIGISEEDQKIIFEEFRQIDGTITRKYNGTGLGLSICRKIADLLNGELAVQSKIGKGSIFSFTIPINYEDSIGKNLNAKVNREVLQKNKKNPVLVIDDDQEVRYTIGQYLISKGYEVVYAEDGEQGIADALKFQPFAITLDIMLPKKDGWNTLKELKENPLTKDIPVILISIISDKSLGFGLGAFEYFVKPISAQKLLSAFNKLENLAQKKVKKIVIVDNDEKEIERYNKEFTSDSILLYPIRDGNSAYKQIVELEPDLVIISLLMDSADGITLSHQLRANRETRNIPVILSTEREFSEKEKGELNNIVENITIEERNHPLDVLKIVRDRLKLQEEFSSQNKPEDKKIGREVVDELTCEENREYYGEVLIVDDEPDVLYTLRELIQACNCKTLLAKNGIECLKVLENKTPDLILLDIMMPEMDGFQTIKRIKENPKLKDIPVFAVSAKAMSDDKKIILKHGFEDFIPKPVNSIIISYKLKKIFNQIRIPENEKNISY